jgi:hypothetical protein
MTSIIHANSKVLQRAVVGVILVNVGVVAAAWLVDGHEALLETLCLPATNVPLTWL